MWLLARERGNHYKGVWLISKSGRGGIQEIILGACWNGGLGKRVGGEEYELESC
jgi:hypothetical protein